MRHQTLTHVCSLCTFPQSLTHVGVLCVSTDVELDYDQFGRLRQWRRGGRSESYAYDRVGRLTSITRPDSSKLVYRFSQPTSTQVRLLDDIVFYLYMGRFTRRGPALSSVCRRGFSRRIVWSMFVCLNGRTWRPKPIGTERRSLLAMISTTMNTEASDHLSA